MRAESVRVIDPNGEQMGIMPVEQAIELALEAGLDLVEVAPLAKPPVCRIMNFGKFKYQQSKRDQLARRKQRNIQIKEVKLRPKTDKHDYDFKVRHVRRFLEAGNKAKVTMMFRGRELAHPEIAHAKLLSLAKDVGDVGVMEVQPTLEGRNMSMVLTPSPAVLKRLAEESTDGHRGNRHGAEHSPED